MSICCAKRLMPKTQDVVNNEIFVYLGIITLPRTSMQPAQASLFWTGLPGALLQALCLFLGGYIQIRDPPQQKQEKGRR